MKDKMKQITIKQATELCEKLTKESGVQFYFKANKGSIKISMEDEIK